MDRKHYTNYLLHFSCVVFLESAESLHRHSFIVIGAFPNITESARGNGLLGHFFDGISKNGVGGGQKPLPTAELPKPLEDRGIVFIGLKDLCRASMLRIDSQVEYFAERTLSHTSNNAFTLSVFKTYRLYSTC